MSPIPALTTTLPRRLPILRRFGLAAALWAGISSASAQDHVPIPLGANAQGIIDAHPPGTRYVLASGVHRALQIVPKDGDVITGEPGAILNGCLPLESWEREGDWWVHTIPVLVPQASPIGVDCADFICLQPQDLYIDGVRLKAVGTLEWVTSDKEWHLNRETGKIYLATDPTGKSAEVGGPSRTAIDCSPPGRPPALGVLIEDLTIERYPSPPQIGAVRLGGGSTIRRCSVTGSHSYGIQLMVSPATIKDCYIADNGMCGIGGTGIGAVIEGCEITRNVWSIYAGKAWDSGGVKLAATHDTVFRRNYIHHNHGPGLWVDIKTNLLTIEENIIELNDWEGILIEISDQSIVRRNICRWNGVQHRRALWGGNICVQNGSSLDIDSNFIETGSDIVGTGLSSPWGSRQGVLVINQVDRIFDENRFEGDFSVRDVRVRNNVHLMPLGGHNGVDYGTLGWNTYEDFLAAGLHWHNNRYLLGQPLDNRWSWRRPPAWDATVAKWLDWEDWITEQDTGSTLETIGPLEFPPTGHHQYALIQSTTGLDYPTLKAQLTRRPAISPLDRDEDGLPDEWEREYADSLATLSASSDPDEDGLTTAEERAAGTHPLLSDTDGDGLTDAWEKSAGLNPLAHDSDRDDDADGRSILEEMQDGTSLTTAESTDLPVDEGHLKVWLSPSDHLVANPEGILLSWSDSGPLALPVGLAGAPRLDGTSPAGLPLVNPDVTVSVPGRENLWGTLGSGSTLCFVYQPSEVELTREWRAVLTNEVYLNQGFRLRLERGCFVFSSAQSGGSLHLAGHTRLKAGQTYIVSIQIEPDGRGGALFLDGQLEALRTSGRVVPSFGHLLLGATGGVLPQSSRFGDITIFSRRLSHRERLSVENTLRRKFVTGSPPGDDDDGDGLPNAWEIAHGLDPRTPSALADEDGDGATNLTEFQRGLDPNDPDTDGDRLPDGWEVTWMTDPLVKDAAEDTDADGLSNLEEFENGTSRLVPDPDPPFLPFVRTRVWWRADHGLDTTEGKLTRWHNSAPAALSAQPQITVAPPPLASRLWNGRPVLQVSDPAAITSGPVELATLFHPAGMTITAAVRPPATPAPAGFRRLLSIGNFLLGVEDDRFVMRDTSGLIVGTSTTTVPTEPFTLSCALPQGPNPALLKINEVLVAEVGGLPIPTTAHLYLGGSDAWRADIAELVVHAGVLPPLHRRLTERVLAAKWRGTGPLVADTDLDGLPDWWEHEAVTDPAVADADKDSDWDGQLNLAAFQASKPGFVWLDADADGMHDGWEVAGGLDQLRDDADEDPDHDDLANVLEQALLSPPDFAEPTSPWSIAREPAESGSTVRLTLRSNQRSWSYRARWEFSPSLASGTWRWLQPGFVTSRGPDATALEETVVSSSPENGDVSTMLRLRLLAE